MVETTAEKGSHSICRLPELGFRALAVGLGVRA